MLSGHFHVPEEDEENAEYECEWVQSLWQSAHLENI